MGKRKRRYIPHLAEFYHDPDTWTAKQAKSLFRKRRSPFESVPLDSVLYEDCVSGMRSLEKSSVDLVIADPPFGIDFDGKSSAYNRDADNVVEGYEEVESDYYTFSHTWMKEAKHLLKEHGSMYIFSGWNHLDDVIRATKDLGLETINHIIWKYNFGLFTRYKFVTSHYHILLVAKDKDEYYFNKIKHYPLDVWELKREYQPGEKKNGTKLPTRLVRRLIRYSSKPGNIVLDPFMGNGTTAVAAKQLWRHFIGFEINEDLEEVIETHLSSAEAGEKHRWFDKRAHIKRLRGKYPRAAREFDRREAEIAANS